MPYVHPPVLWDRADAFNETQASGIGEVDFGYKHGAEGMTPGVAFRGLAGSEVRIRRRIEQLLLRISSYARAKEAVRFLRKASNQARLDVAHRHPPAKLQGSSRSRTARRSTRRRSPDRRWRRTPQDARGTGTACTAGGTETINRSLG